MNASHRVAGVVSRAAGRPTLRRPGAGNGLSCQCGAAPLTHRRIDPARLDPDTIDWGDQDRDRPAVVALVGRPDAAGERYAFAIRTPPGFQDPPHAHETEARFTVLRGAMYLGFGPVEDRTLARTLGPGQDVLIPAGVAHFNGTDGGEPAVIVCVTTGPWLTHFPRSGPSPRHG